MAVPDQVKAMSQNADDLQTALAKESTPKDGTVPPATPEPGTVPETPPARQDSPPDNNQPAQQPNLEQQYKSLLGRVEAQASQLKDLRAQNDLLYKQVSELNREKLTLEQDLQDAKAQATKEPPTDTDVDSDPKLLDVEQMAKYGAEFGEMAKALNNVMTYQQAAKPTQPDITTPAPQEGVTLNMLKTSIIADVFAVHGIDYNAMDSSKEFIGWLAQFDATTGAQNGAAWNEAIAVRDKAACLRVINNFLVSEAGQAYQAAALSTPEPGITPNQQPTIPQSGEDPTQTPQQGEIWTKEKVTAFFKKLAGGGFKDNPEEAKKIEADIFAAQGTDRYQG